MRKLHNTTDNTGYMPIKLHIALDVGCIIKIQREQSRYELFVFENAKKNY